MPDETIETEEQALQPESKESSIVAGTIEIDGGIYINIHIKQSEGVAQSVVDESGNAIDHDITKTDIIGSLDRLALNAIIDYFDKHGIVCDGQPWTTEDQDDIPGYLSISGYGLNQAIAQKNIMLKQDEFQEEYWEFEGIQEYIDEYKKNHIDDIFEDE